MAEGVRKVNEWITSPGRTLILTDVNVQAASVPDGTLFIDPIDGTFKIKLTGGTAWTNVSIANLVPPKSITGAYIADRTVTNGKIALDGVLGENIKDAEITTSKVANLAITDIKIANNAITGEKLADGTVTAAKLADLVIGTAKLIDSAVTNPKISNDSISTVKLQGGSVTEAKVATDAITTIKIKDLNVTTAKLADLVVTTAKIANLAVTTEKLADLSISTGKIANSAVTELKLADLAVTTAKLADGSVTEIKLAGLSVSAAKIKDLTITGAKIAAGTIALTKLDTTTQNLINAAIRVNSSNNNTATVGGNLHVSGNITATGDISGNRLYNAVYNDLAEGFIPEETDLEPGDIVEVTSTGGVIKAGSYSKGVVGIVSDCFATCFGASPEELAAKEKIAIGLIGRVPVKIAGRAAIGDFVVSCGNGIGVAMKTAIHGQVIGKVIQHKFTDDIDRVMCLIFPG